MYGLKQLAGCLFGLLAACTASGAQPVALCGELAGVLRVEGMVWQTDRATIQPSGAWERLGLDSLLIQWLAVDDQAFVSGTSLPAHAVLPDWAAIGQQPWAQKVIVGLAGYFNEQTARASLKTLAQSSTELARVKLPLQVAGWYFPVEIDPTWEGAAVLRDYLKAWPRPLWVSAYDSNNLGPDVLAQRLAEWLPKDVGVFFQDGVGLHARDATTALRYTDALVKYLGEARVKMIAEAFRPKVGGGFRSATAEELCTQLRAYRRHRVYLFDGPHYVTDTLIDDLTGVTTPSTPWTEHWN